MPVLKLPFVKLGGRRLHPPPLFGLVQTDGSYVPSRKEARTSIIFNRADGTATLRNVRHISAKNSTETEWASVEFGIKFALAHNEEAFGIENDCLSVIQGLLHTDTPLRHEYARYYRSSILGLARQAEWVGIRWIPREDNLADRLFR
jgi:hypothetical protein